MSQRQTKSPCIHRGQSLSVPLKVAEPLGLADHALTHRYVHRHSLPALWRGKCSISKIGQSVNRGRKLNPAFGFAQLSEIAMGRISELEFPISRLCSRVPKRTRAICLLVARFLRPPIIAPKLSFADCRPQVRLWPGAAYTLKGSAWLSAKKREPRSDPCAPADASPKLESCRSPAFAPRMSAVSPTLRCGTLLFATFAFAAHTLTRLATGSRKHILATLEYA